MIDSTGNIPKTATGVPNRAQGEREVSSAAAQNKATTGTTARDSVELTPEVRDAMKAAESTNHAAEVDKEKVAAIKKALAEGTYPLDSQRTAANMQALEGLLSGVGKG